MKLTIILFFILFSFTNCESQKIDWKSREIKNNTDLLKSTVKILCFSNDTNEIGTSYFFYNNKNDSLYLITNKHITANFKRARVWIERKGTLNNLLSSYFIEDLQSLVQTPNDNIDLAIINLSRVDSFKKYVSNFIFKTFTFANLPPISVFNNIDISQNFIALSFPYPLDLWQQYKALPFVINCSLSAYRDFLDSSVFFINGALSSGCSGSPIILRKDKKFYLMGTFKYSYSSPSDIITYYTDSAYVPISLKAKIIDTSEKRFNSSFGVSLPIQIGLAIKYTAIIFK